MTLRPRPVRYDHILASQTLAASDRKLAQLLERAGPFTLRLKPTASPFEALLESIVHQQLNGRAAKTIHDRVLALFADNSSTPAHPTPEALLRLPDNRLRAAGLSAGKLAALRDLAEKTRAGIVPSLAQLRRMTDEDIIAHLTQVRGIGVWTAEMLLIFRLGRPNVLPVGDYGVRKGFALTFGTLRPGVRVQAEDLPDAETMRRRAARWHPWCSVASWYLWRACDLAVQDAAAQNSSTPPKARKPAPHRKVAARRKK